MWSGEKEVIGSWKIMPMRLPRIALNSFERGDSAARSTLPPTLLVEQDLAAGDVRGARQDAEDRLRGDGLARTRFADQRDRAARPDAHATGCSTACIRPASVRNSTDRSRMVSRSPAISAGSSGFMFLWGHGIAAHAITVKRDAHHVVIGVIAPAASASS